MKLNFNNTNLSQETSMAHTTNSSLDLTSTKLKIWWQGLPQEEKQKVCRLDTPSVMSDIANAANNALVVCKLNHTYKKKDLISWTKSKNQDAEVVSQTFEFSFVGKEILEDCLAELFSCFYIFIARCRKTEEFSDNERQSCQAEPKSHIGVNEERLDSLLDFLSHSLCDLSENRKSLLQKKDVSELYFSLIKDLSHKTMFNNNSTLHAYMKALLERLAVYSFLLEHQIYTAYFEAAPQEQERVEQSVLSQLSKLTPLATTTPLITKTVTQLEKECSAHELSVDQNSTASGSPRNPIVLGNPQNLNLEELSQKLLQKSPKDNGAGSMTRELSEPPSEMKPKLHEEFFPQNYSHSKNSAIPMWNESFDANMFTYEGCLVGNLQIPFDITDQVLSEEENEQQSEAGEEEQRDFGIIEYDDIFGFGEQQEELPEEAEKEEALLSNAGMSSFNVMSNPMMNFQSAYTVQQNYLYAGQDYYSPYSVQQNYPMMSYNYTVPMMYMTSPNNMDSVNGENLNYSIYTQRQKEYESQVSYDNDNSYYQTQKFSEHYNKVEYEGHHQAGQTDEKSYYIARDKPKYEVRPKLPPRLQKRKENMVRT